MKALTIIAAFVLLLPTACGRAANPTVNATVDAPAVAFDRRAMLANVAEQLILPGHETLLTALNELETAVRALAASPDAATLDAAQEAWLAANLARMAVLTYRLGPVDESLLHNRLDNRPARVPFIDGEMLAGDMVLDTAYIDSVGSSSVGLGAMEYLLFDPAGGDAAVLTTLTDPSNAARRRELLVALAAAMPQKAEALRRIWSADGENYAAAFVEANMDGGELQGSINMLANQMINDVEEIAASRLGMPLGMRTGGAIRPDLAEAPYSGASLPRIIAALEGQKATFTGGDGLGFDDYLDFLGATYGEEPLSQAIVARFDTSLAALRAIDAPLETAVQNDPAAVTAAYDEVLSLLTLLKVDMVNHLGLMLTFNDNDGD